MATPNKVREFFSIIQAEAGYSILLEEIVGGFALDLLSQGSKDEACIAQQHIKLAERFKWKLIDYAMRIVSEEFTDAELDELASICNLPVVAKTRHLLPMIMDVFSMLYDGRIDIISEMDEIVEQSKRSN